MSRYEYTQSQWNANPEQSDPEAGARIWNSIMRILRIRRIKRNVFIGTVSAAAVAASLFVGYIMGGRTVQPESPVQAEQHTSLIAASGNTNILPDGSKVWLESGSSLSFTDGFADGRSVTLKGSASFDIVKDAQGSAFKVLMDDAAVTVHGTSFSISQKKSEEIVVTLYEGAVDFSAADRTIALEPGRSLTWNKSTASASTSKFFSNIEFCAGDFKLQDVSLATLADFIRWRYSVEVYVSPNVNQGKIKLTGMVGHDESVDSVIDKVCYVMGLNYSRKEDSYRLFKK